MARNHFSKAGGPYFLNNGTTSHKEHHNHDDSHTHEHMNKTFKPLHIVLSCIIPMVFVIAIAMFVIH
jgi:hypothetical protein